MSQAMAGDMVKRVLILGLQAAKSGALAVTMLQLAYLLLTHCQNLSNNDLQEVATALVQNFIQSTPHAGNTALRKP